MTPHSCRQRRLSFWSVYSGLHLGLFARPGPVLAAPWRKRDCQKQEQEQKQKPKRKQHGLPSPPLCILPIPISWCSTSIGVLHIWQPMRMCSQPFPDDEIFSQEPAMTHLLRPASYFLGMAVQQQQQQQCTASWRNTAASTARCL